ncbi:MAG: ABC transporter permease subunit [Bryobacterales bacterium]|nr:ABC transporter permease subunit [Bryobacterales bacterium]
MIATQTLALIRDTFREAMARKIFWGLFGLSTAMILFFLLLLRIDVVEGGVATMSLFGYESRRGMDVERMVRGVHGSIATFLYSFGLFLALFASSGLVPSLLEPGRIELLLSKPVARWHLLLGRYLGNVLIVLANTAWLVGGVWLIFGIKTGIWTPQFLLAIFTTVFLFCVLLSVVFLMGVLFESAALATMVPVALMLISPILAQEKTVVKLLSSETARTVWRTLYQVFPKVFDIGRTTLQLVRREAVESWDPFFTSALFGVAVLALAVWRFERRDF